MSIGVVEQRGISACGRWFGALALGFALGLLLLHPAAADNANVLARALVETPFDQSQLRHGYRHLETTSDGKLPEEATQSGIVAGVAAAFEGPGEAFRDAAVYYLIFATAAHAEVYYESQFDMMVEDKEGLNAVTDITIETVDHTVVPVRCFLSATEEVFSCMYLEPDLSTVIQMVAGPGSRSDASDAEGLRQEFLAGQGAIALSGVLTATRTHLLRAAGR